MAASIHADTPTPSRTSHTWISYPMHHSRERERPRARPAGTRLYVHSTAYCYTGGADPQAPGGMAAIYRDLAADEDRTRQITADVAAALARGRHCLVLTQWIAHLQKLADALRGRAMTLSYCAAA